jgi:flavin-dependent dehydrogenase
MYDAIIVGARCAGSPTALLLARKGYRVLLVDRTTFPDDTLSTHMIWPPGAARLARWGLLDRVAASNCPAMRRVSFDVGEFALAGTPPPMEGTAEIFAPRRTRLDKILVDAAAEAGADVREGFAVQELVTPDGRVTGIRGGGKAGPTVVETARLVIGADGVHSIVARSVEAPAYHAKPPLACWYYTYWSGVAGDGVEYYVRPGRVFGILPTNDGLACIPTAWTRAEFPAYRADIEGNYLKTLALAPAVAERVRRGKREERFYGTADVPNYFRKPFGPGWALVGDAGYHKDPVTAQGITDAFHTAELLAEAIDEGFSGRRPLEDALADYQRRRDAALLPMYDFTCQMATLEPPTPDFQALLDRLRGTQAGMNRFFGALAGTVSIPEFFAQGA